MLNSGADRADTFICCLEKYQTIHYCVCRCAPAVCGLVVDLAVCDLVMTARGSGLVWPGVAWPGVAWPGVAWPVLSCPGLCGLAWPGLA